MAVTHDLFVSKSNLTFGVCGEHRTWSCRKDHLRRPKQILVTPAKGGTHQKICISLEKQNLANGNIHKNHTFSMIIDPSKWEYTSENTFSLISDPGKWELQHASENIWFSSMSDASKWEHTRMFVDRLTQQMGAQTNAEVTLWSSGQPCVRMSLRGSQLRTSCNRDPHWQRSREVPVWTTCICLGGGGSFFYSFRRDAHRKC